MKKLFLLQQSVGIGLVFGAGVGIIIGLIFNLNIGFAISFGAGLGLLIGSVITMIFR